MKRILKSPKYISIIIILFLYIILNYLFLKKISLTNEKINDLTSNEKLKDDILKIVEGKEEIKTRLPSYPYDLNKIRIIKSIRVNEKNKIEKTKIHISYGLDDKITFIILVSMTSIMESCNKNKSLIIFHMMLSNNFKKSNIEILSSISKNYPRNCEIIFYDMGDLFNEQKPWKGSLGNYYRLVLPDILFNIERIIYLDSDTLAFKDLTEMYFANFNNNYILGFKDIVSNNELSYLGVITKNYVCSGVLLMNLEGIRKSNKNKELLTFIKQKRTKYYDQDAINYVFNGYTGLLPIKFGLFSYNDENEILEKYYNYVKDIFSKEQLIEAIKDPGLIHFTTCWPKFYYKDSKYNSASSSRGKDCLYQRNLFYFYAKKTNYYKEIYNLYMK